MLLLLTSTIASLTKFSPTSWAGSVYWAINGVSAVAITAIALIAWGRARRYQFALILGAGVVTFASTQILLRTTTIWIGNHPVGMVAHLLVATFTLGAVLALGTSVSLPAGMAAKPGLGRGHRVFFNTIVLTTASFVVLLVTGAVVTVTGTGSACPDWPLCQGEIIPQRINLDVAINLLHRFVTIAFGVLVAAIVLQSRRYYTNHALISRWSKILGLLFLGQILTGGLYPLIGSSVVITFLHLSLTAAIWGSLIILATICYLTVETVLPWPETRNPAPAIFSLKQKAAIYFKLTKPWIMILLLLTTATAMFISAGSVPSIWLILITLLGGALSAGGASVLNSYVDSDIDQLMSRTSRRATVTGSVTPQETLIFGLTLSTLSFVIFAVFVNTLSAILSTLGILYYVFFYTLYLKRTTIHNIVIGGAAGAIPPLVGWTAVTNSLDLGAFYLFAIIFFWTPPHTWALALMVKKDYAQAQVPMLPVVAGDKETTYQTWLYSILLVVLTLLPVTFGLVSWAYFVVALILGAQFLRLAWQLWQNYDKALSRRLYKYSQRYLALIFLAMAIDRLIF